VVPFRMVTWSIRSWSVITRAATSCTPPVSPPKYNVCSLGGFSFLGALFSFLRSRFSICSALRPS